MGFELDLSDRTAIITGGGRGIGRTIALVFSEAGADVVLAARTSSEIEETAEHVRENGAEALAVETDVTSPSDLKTLVERAVDRFGPPDTLINNAGVNIHPTGIENTPEEVETMMRVNAMGLYYLSQRFGESFKQSDRDRGRIINVSSVHAQQGHARRIVYSGSKAAVIGLTRGLATAFARSGITVNSISPGNIQTGDADQSSRSDFDIESIPIPRVGKPEDVAYLCLYLATPFADYITGENIAVDGGISITTGPYQNIER